MQCLGSLSACPKDSFSRIEVSARTDLSDWGTLAVCLAPSLGIQGEAGNSNRL